MKTKKTQTPTGRIQDHRHPASPVTAKFIDHMQELRRRLYFIAFSIIGWSIAAYFVQHRIVDVLLGPTHGQNFIYTTAGGGLDFLFRICLYTGLVLSTPVIVYQLLKFMQPLMRGESSRFAARMSVACGVLALVGISFGYFLGLPAAVDFLLHQFTTVQIQPLLTIHSYLSFVIAYLLGSALIFQLPLLLIAINRIKPLTPQRLFHYERWVILAAFVLGAIINPSPHIMSQLVVAVPFILTYQLGIGIIAVINRQKPAVAPVVAPVTQPLVTALPQTIVTTEPALVRPVARPRVISDIYRPAVVEKQPQPTPIVRTAVPESAPRKQMQFMDFIPNRVMA